jgi:RNA polymerase sigma-32 factor
MSTQTKALQRISNTLPVYTDSLQSYLQQINAIPLLSQEEEFTLAKRYREQGDLGAAQQLVLSHLRYVAKIAKGYNGYGLALNDLIQEGTIGLMKAVKRFDPAKGVRLVSFAVHWIKSEIHEFVIRNWRIVKIATTKAQRKLFFNLRQSKKRLGWFSQEEVQSVANDLGVSPKDVLEMETRLNAHDHTFDMTEDDEETAFSPVQYLPAAIENEPDFDSGYEQPQAELQAVLETLDPRSQDIVAKRWLNDEKMSLKELAEHHQISIERVRQLEKTAFQKMRQALAQSENL